MQCEAIKFSCSVDFTGSTAIVHELAVRGLVVLLCGGSQLTQLALKERGGGWPQCVGPVKTTCGVRANG